MIRTRFAPSPTGYPHVGNIRTAIFSYLHAKAHGGEFILRIEDTDRERFVANAVSYIEESLKWLDLGWDNEDVIHQSTRLDYYKKYSDQLVSEGKAYKCFCSKERLEKLREEQIKAKKPPAYDRHCRSLTKDEVEKLEKEGQTPVVRFAIPDDPREISWEDAIRGKVSIQTVIQDDFVIIKSDGYPTYHLANVVDDHHMEITDVIRGEEWIPSTPKHILLYRAFGWTHPTFAHMPHIIGKDRAKLSKRHGDTSIMDYKEKGYLPEAMVNFLALLGWNDGTTKEIFTKEELIKAFDISRVGKSPAVFDIDRLNWINGEKIRSLPVEDLVEELIGFNPEIKKLDKEKLQKAVQVMQTRMVTLADFQEADYFFNDPEPKPDIIVFKKSTKENTEKGLNAVLDRLEKIGDLESAEECDKLLTGVVEELGLSNGDVFWPVRVALSGQEKSPSPGEIMWALGRAESLQRIKRALEQL